MKKPYVIAAFLAIAALAWIVSGQLGTAERTAKAGSEILAEAKVPKVRVRRQTARLRVGQLVLNGRTEASRKVSLRAETVGRIVGIAAERGARLSRGDVILRIAMDDRQSRLAEAQTKLAQRRIEYGAAKTLSKKGFRSEIKLAEAEALLNQARAELKRIETDISHTTIRTPFDGVLDSRPAEIGGYVKIGDNVATVVDLDPILLVGQVSERDIGKISLGGVGTGRLVTGEDVDGVVRFISRQAEPTTRTFRIELEVANPDGRLADGITAELRLPLARIRAHRVSPAILTLADDGQIGVKIVDSDDRVVFVPVDILAHGSDGMWVGGLPDDVTLIVVGQDFVKTGQRVAPIFADPSAS